MIDGHDPVDAEQSGWWIRNRTVRKRGIVDGPSFIEINVIDMPCIVWTGTPCEVLYHELEVFMIITRVGYLDEGSVKQVGGHEAIVVYGIHGYPFRILIEERDQQSVAIVGHFPIAL